MKFKLALTQNLIPNLEALVPGRRYLPDLTEDYIKGILFLGSASERPLTEKVALIMDNGQLYWDVDENYALSPELFGRPFIHGLFDCYTFLKDYYKEMYNIELPTKSYEDEWWNHSKNYYLDSVEEANFNIVKAPLQIGDVLGMKINSPVINHTAIYIGDSKIAHHMSPGISCEEVYRPAYLKWTAGYFRHRDMT